MEMDRGGGRCGRLCGWPAEAFRGAVCCCSFMRGGGPTWHGRLHPPTCWPHQVAYLQVGWAGGFKCGPAAQLTSDTQVAPTPPPAGVSRYQKPSWARSSTERRPRPPTPLHGRAPITTPHARAAHSHVQARLHALQDPPKHNTQPQRPRGPALQGRPHLSTGSCVYMARSPTSTADTSRPELTADVAEGLSSSSSMDEDNVVPLLAPPEARGGAGQYRGKDVGGGALGRCWFGIGGMQWAGPFASGGTGC